jgi:hypothetical protein
MDMKSRDHEMVQGPGATGEIMLTIDLDRLKVIIHVVQVVLL